MPLTPPPDAPPAAPSEPGAAPTRTNPATFRALADAFVAWQAGDLQPKLAALRAWLVDYVAWAATHVDEMEALQVVADAVQAAAQATAHIYPGTFAIAPTTRPDGSPIQNGDRYTGDDATEYVRVGGAWSSAVVSADDAAQSALESAGYAAAALMSEGGAATASATAGSYPNTAASNVPRGAVAFVLTPGSAGANGTNIAATFTGGNYLGNPTILFDIVGGAATNVRIVKPGLYIGSAPTAPTVTLPGAAGGAALTLTSGFLVASGDGYWVQSADGSTIDRYKNVAGVATPDTAITSLPTVVFDATAFPGTRNLYGPILTPRTKDLAGSDLAAPFPPDAQFTVTVGTANDYSAALDGLVPGAPFILYVQATSGTLGVITFTMNGVKTATRQRRGLWVYEGTVPAATTTATLVVKNGSAVAVLTGYARYATGPVGASAATPQESSVALESYFDSGMPTSDQELLRAEPSIMLADATSAVVTVTNQMAGVVLGNTIHVMGRSQDMAGADATINDMSLQVTATSQVIFSLYPLAGHPGYWYREIYLDPALFTGGTITLVRTNANNHNNSNHYDETARIVTFYIWRDGLPRFYPSAKPAEGKGIQHAGNMRYNRAYLTTAAAQFNGYFPALFGGMRSLWLRSMAGGDYLVARKNAITGDFIGATLAVTHAGGGWRDFTSQMPAEWKLPREGFVVGLAPNPANATPGLLEYGVTVVGDLAATSSSWFSGTSNGDDPTFFAAGQDRLPGIYVEVEDKPGAVKRMGRLPLTRTGAADYHLDFVLGQSGYEGYALNASNFADYSKITPAASLMWSKNAAALVPLHDPVAQNNPSGGSLWPAYADEFEKRMLSRAVILIPSAFGGTVLGTDWWNSSTGAKPKWTQALADYDATLDYAWAANLPISSAAVHIDLGEGDGLAGTSAATFKAHLVSWIAQIRALISPYVPIFYRPPGRGAAANVANFAQIRRAIQELASEDPYFHIASNGEVITEYRGLKLADHYHDTLPAQEESGRMLAALVPAIASKAMPKDYTLDVARP